MENNIENKAKFFAAYWGCEIIYTGTGKPIKFLGKTSRMSYENADRFQSVLYSNQRSLLLKSLSSISNDDAKQLSATLGRVVSLERIVQSSSAQESSADLVKELVSNYSKANILWSLPSQFTDKARELGYLIDFNGLSTEELISRGWAVTTNLKTE